MGRPVAVLEGETAQLLDARLAPTTPASAAMSRDSASTAGPAVVPGVVLTGCQSG